MCRWGCSTVDSTYACKWCGTRFCRECLRGDFHGEMKDETPLVCKKCKQPNCQGKRVEYTPGARKADGDENDKKRSFKAVVKRPNKKKI